MRIGLILTEVGAGIGGRFTFQEMLLEAVSNVQASSTHEFRLYTAGASRYSGDSAGWWLRRGPGIAATLAVAAVRETQDALLRKRLVQLRTPLERRLQRDRIELAWFPTTYVEEAGCPFLSTVFDLEHRTKPWFPEVTARGEFERRERTLKHHLPKATRVIVPNETAAGQVAEFYGVPRTSCLVLGHPTPGFALEAGHDAEASPSAPPYLLYPAQFWPHKNHAAALDVLEELHRRGNVTRLVLVGSDKGQLDHVRAQVRERALEAFVEIRGFVPTSELVELYRHAHALLFLSRFGPENLPPLEAMATGCPAIVADVPGSEEQYGDAALRVDWRDASAVADAVVLLDDPGRRASLVARGRRRAAAWPADDYVRGVLDFVDEFELERRLWP